VTAAPITLLLAATTLALTLQADHRTLVAGLPLELPVLGWSVPAAVLQQMLPVTLPVCLWASRRRWSASGAGARLATLGCVATLVLVWLVSLARHDRPLSLLHCLLILAALLAATRCRRLALLGVSVTAGALTLVSYGAIWGETRCREPAPVTCLVDDGPRVWVPRLLDQLGIAAFAQLAGYDLRGADLSDRDLRYADLRNAVLNGVDLSGSNLRRARMQALQGPDSRWRRAYLDGASLRGAELRRADMSRVHAYRLDLRQADLREANMSRGSFSHAYLADARFQGTRLPGTYLRFTEGLSPAQLSGACGDSRTRLPYAARLRECGQR
jgi:uncharacterized protein YjbI with pentapeptide repeats